VWSDLALPLFNGVTPARGRALFVRTAVEGSYTSAAQARILGAPLSGVGRHTQGSYLPRGFGPGKRGALSLARIDEMGLHILGDADRPRTAYYCGC